MSNVCRDNLSRFEGAGVYYAATFVEAQLCGREEEVIVVGGGDLTCS
jgi:thioredoxin reductase (NADPH)